MSSGDGSSLEVVDIWRTIQGEGPYAGESAVFVRLAGCVIQCPLCDTDYTSGRKVMSIQEIESRVLELIAPYEEYKFEDWTSNRNWLVVITGGEPLRQSCGPLVRALVDVGLKVQIETNGLVDDRTLTEETSPSDYTIVCSPKGDIHKSLKWSNVRALKYVVKAGMVDPVDGLPTRALDLNTRPERPWVGFKGKVYVQPCDEDDVHANDANLKAAIESCYKFGYTLGIQLHKIIGVK